MMTSNPGAGDNRLKSIDPENLLVLDIGEVEPLLALQYQKLAERTKELVDRANETPIIVTDRHALGRQSDLLAQIRDHIEGEIEATRTKVKAGPLAATRAIDAYFFRQAQELETWRQNANAAQRRFIIDEQAKERQSVPLDSVPAKVKIQSTIGTTTSVGTVWAFEITDMLALCKAVADGLVPASVVQPNEGIIRTLVRSKPPLRNKPGQDIGIRIYEDIQIRRRG